MEMTLRIAQDLRRLEEGVVMFDSLEGRDFLVIAPVIAVLADNPRHSEVLNQMVVVDPARCFGCSSTPLSNAVDVLL